MILIMTLINGGHRLNRVKKFFFLTVSIIVLASSWSFAGVPEDCRRSLTNGDDLRARVLGYINENGGLDSLDIISTVGHFSTVYKITIEEQALALKVPRKKETSFLLLEEYNNLTAISHPNIVTPLTLVNHNDQYMLVLPYLGEWSLQRLIKEDLMLTEPAVQRLGQGLLRTSTYFAKHNLVPEDLLNLDNIMVTPEGRPILIDMMHLKKLDERMAEIHTSIQMRAIGFIMYYLLRGDFPSSQSRWTSPDKSFSEIQEEIKQLKLRKEFESLLLRMFQAEASGITPSEAYEVISELPRLRRQEDEVR